MFSSYDIARFSDVVYSEAISLEQFEKLNIENPIILGNDGNIIFYKQRKFIIRPYDIIFTHTGNLENLFFLLKNLDKSFNLILITHQADTMITKKLFAKKPECINHWFALNVGYKNNSLVPLPLGIANDYSYKKNIVSKDLLHDINEKKFHDKKVLVYVNFNENTNKKERSWIKPYFNKIDWAEVEEDNLSIKQYADKIKNASFVICPWGNGIDSHRIWETLFLGSIPIVKKHTTFNNLKDLPIFFVNDFKELTEEKLKEFLLSLESSESFNKEKLNVNYWENIVNKEKNKALLDTNLEQLIIENKLTTKYFKIKSFTKSWLKSKWKIIDFYYQKIISMFH